MGLVGTKKKWRLCLSCTAAAAEEEEVVYAKVHSNKLFPAKLLIYLLDTKLQNKWIYGANLELMTGIRHQNLNIPLTPEEDALASLLWCSVIFV